MSVTVTEAIILIGGGFFAGCINTLAGYGSVICLTILMDVVGLPPLVANGSNRINVLSTGMIGSYIFHKNGKLRLDQGKRYMLFTFLGAMVGVYVATVVSNETFRGIFKYLVIVLFVLLLVKPQKWLKESSGNTRIPTIIALPVFLAIGFYGGFIQMGVGLFLLATLVLIGNYQIIEANALKIFITTIYSVVVTLIFWWRDLIHWEAGLLLAVGASLGGLLTSNFASHSSKASLYAYRLLVFMIIFIIIYQFEIWTWF